ncbi:leucyl/phenylalanyl-tRNA--protein transferase [Phenylobacterium sp.]|uniref:leucyl/phenylalanyl-tRNA--protein transferase n=1 Tax=Phenylobacterium sp. TaxID=1871053 RepID=UPI0025FAF9B9|nr:leucyl/phenylalanyl-tRNA--protein transferase [Phenylobacterium sp.]
MSRRPRPHPALDFYARGVFPMAQSPTDPSVFLVEPEFRGVFPLKGLALPRRLQRTLRQDRFEVRVNSAFQAVLDACADPERPGAWINPALKRMYQAMHADGSAHSVETWRNGRLVGGLFGVSLKGAFFGESMFSIETDASKVALAHLAARLILGGFQLLDAQFITDHLASLGAEEIPRAAYLERLAGALAVEGVLGPPAALSGVEVLQVISQAS